MLHIKWPVQLVLSLWQCGVTCRYQSPAASKKVGCVNLLSFVTLNCSCTTSSLIGHHTHRCQMSWVKSSTWGVQNGLCAVSVFSAISCWFVIIMWHFVAGFAWPCSVSFVVRLCQLLYCHTSKNSPLHSWRLCFFRHCSSDMEQFTKCCHVTSFAAHVQMSSEN